MKQLFYLISIFFWIACSENQPSLYTHYASFPIEQELTSKAIALDTADVLRYPFRITVKENVAVILDLHHPDYFYHAFTYPEWKYITSFGKRGGGADEMIAGSALQFISLDSIWTLDNRKQQINRWQLLASEGTVKCEETVDLDKVLGIPMDFCVTDSTFLITNYQSGHRFVEVNRKGKLLRAYGNIPTEKRKNKQSSPALALAWRSFIASHPSHPILALATQLGEVLEINSPGEIDPIVLYGTYGEPVFQETPNGQIIPTGIMGFSDIKITENYIYAVFHGRSFKEISAVYQKGERPEDGGHFIYIYDLKGNPVKKYTLTIPIYGIDVNEETNTIIATSVNTDDSIVEIKM